jgi:hypothetical protein
VSTGTSFLVGEPLVQQCALFPLPYFQLKFSNLQDKFDGLDLPDFVETGTVP